LARVSSSTLKCDRGAALKSDRADARRQVVPERWRAPSQAPSIRVIY